MDENGYPDDNELATIRNWDYKDIVGLMAYIRDLWADYGYWNQDCGSYRISTGGWSGNEDIIRALQENAMFWAMCWMKSERGGHYVFEIRKVKDGKEEKKKGQD